MRELKCELVDNGSKIVPSGAPLQGATSFKFGIYFGRTKSDPTRKYRFTEKFGTTEGDAFAAVRVSLVDLVVLGAADAPDFAAIDANPLSQMFKAKFSASTTRSAFLPCAVPSTCR